VDQPQNPTGKCINPLCINPVIEAGCPQKLAGKGIINQTKKLLISTIPVTV
jgi:hypothetical protein